METTVHTISIGKDNVIYKDSFKIQQSPISINTAHTLINLKRKNVLKFDYTLIHNDGRQEEVDMECFIERVNKILERV